MRLIEYLGVANLISEEQEARVSRYFKGSIEELLSRSVDEHANWAELPGHPGIEFSIDGHHNAGLREAGGDRLIGGYIYILPYLDPDYRGRGLMAALHKEADLVSQRFTTANYTMDGLQARARTHALHVEDAIDEGLHVPDEVMADYTIVSGRALLTNELTRERFWEERVRDGEILRSRLEARAERLGILSAQPDPGPAPA
ncbi:hypothetical protein [Paracoccus sp. ME4]|uniref:hypothetical protein n=1 Tax=Paracoccus sp. ME4 TaxID=3138066 RepID=UPI00398AF48C